MEGTAGNQAGCSTADSCPPLGVVHAEAVLSKVSRPLRPWGKAPRARPDAATGPRHTSLIRGSSAALYRTASWCRRASTSVSEGAWASAGSRDLTAAGSTGSRWGPKLSTMRCRKDRTRVLSALSPGTACAEKLRATWVPTRTGADRAPGQRSPRADGCAPTPAAAQAASLERKGRAYQPGAHARQPESLGRNTHGDVALDDWSREGAAAQQAGAYQGHLQGCCEGPVQELSNLRPAAGAQVQAQALGQPRQAFQSLLHLCAGCLRSPPPVSAQASLTI